MLTKRKKSKKSILVTEKPFSLIIFFYFTNHDWNAGEKLMPFLQPYHLNLERLKGSGNNVFTKNLPFFCQNANFVAWSHDFLSLKDCLFLNQSLLAQVNVLAFCYHGDLWTPSRLKQLPKSATEISYPNMSTLTSFWKSLARYTF